jgi:trimeric autotransporter adhesin
MLKLKYIIGCMAITVLFSCKKDGSTDIKGNPETTFFTNSTNLGNMPGNSVSFPVVNIPDAASSGWLNLSAGLPATIKIPVYATKPVSREVTIAGELDNSLVAAYNAANNTSYVELPAGILSTQSLSAKILEGQTTAADSFSIAVNPADLKTLTAPAYMAAVKLTAVSDESVGRITSNADIRVVYVVLNIELRQIRYLATAADVTGTLQSKTTWVAGFNPTPSTVGNILDGSTGTYNRWTPPTSPVQVDLDMQTAKNMTGFRLYTSTSSTTSPTQINVSVSEDGINYKAIGLPLRANLTYASGYTYVVFYKPIAARYLRLVVSYSTSTNTQNGRIGELDVYAS